jgi:hypothetical protein
MKPVTPILAALWLDGFGGGGGGGGALHVGGKN